MYAIFGARKACIARELTKIHEEFIRDNLKELLEIDETTLKGEMVLIVEGKNKEEQPHLENAEILKMVNAFMEKGMSTKDAIKRVSEITSVNKHYIYKIYHIN